jgi:hypothetical protein
VGLALALFLGMLALQEVGRRLGRRLAANDPDGLPGGVGVVEAAVFALLGLLLAFQFGRAASRLDTRRQLAVQEANAIGTAWLRLDLLAAEQQPALRDLFRRYTDARIRVLEALPSLEATAAENQTAQKLQGEIWSGVIASCRKESGSTASLLLLPALNDMIDITTTRSVAARTYAPALLVVFVYCVALTSALLAGIAMSGGTARSLCHMIVFAAITAITVYVILDLEHPSLGFIRIGAADQAMYEVRQSMN